MTMPSYPLKMIPMLPPTIFRGHKSPIPFPSIKLNEQKSLQVILTLRHGFCPPVYLYNGLILRAETVRYLGLYFDKRILYISTVVDFMANLFTSRNLHLVKLFILSFLM